MIVLMRERCKPFLHWDLLWNTDFADFTDLFCSCLAALLLMLFLALRGWV